MHGQELNSATERDIVKTALKFRAERVTATDAERQRAKQTLEQFYPETPPSDPNARPLRICPESGQTSPETGQLSAARKPTQNKRQNRQKDVNEDCVQQRARNQQKH